MSLLDIVDDLIKLEELAEHESDASRRRDLNRVRTRVARRDRGAKVSDAARVLALSAPTVRSWIEAGVLRSVPETRPVQVDVLSLAAAKRAVDEIRRRADDPHLLADVLRLLRDRAALAGADVVAGLEDARSGRVGRLDKSRLDELLPPRKRSRRPTSH